MHRLIFIPVKVGYTKQFFSTLLVSVLIFCAEEFCFAQALETNIWYFGNHAGLDFNSGSPVAINGSHLNTLEGCITMSDRNTGQLLFYSDGLTVWDRTHDSMPNGSALWGHHSSTQSCLAVPNPADGNKYFLFTASAQAGFIVPQPYTGIAYSLIDMTLNGGLGDVVATQKNIPLLDSATEKLTAVQHCNGRDFWVVAHKWNSNEFYSYLVSSAGISAPVISAVGLVHEDAGSGQGSEAVGYMKISPDGNHLALACFSQMNKAELFDFDNVTGVVSNPIILNLPFSTNGYAGPYGVSFSPDDTRLYVVWHDYIGNPNYIFQYDITLGSDSAIQASRTLVAATSGWNFGALQLATDHKLYIANFSFNNGNPNAPIGYPTIGLFPNPNSLGLACGWIPNGVTLAANTTSIWGLPNFVESYLSNHALSLGPDLYLNSPFSVMLDAGPGFSSYLWSDGSTSQTLSVTTNGTYWVSVQNQNGCTQTDTLHIFTTVSVPEEATFSAFNVSYSEMNSVQISLYSHIRQNFSASIFSIDGKLVSREFFNDVFGIFRHEFELNFSRGIYVLNLQGSHIAKNVKLIVR